MTFDRTRGKPVITVRKVGDPMLRQVAEDVLLEPQQEGLKDLIKQMWKTMYAERGIGLAAPQVGISINLAVVDLFQGTMPNARVVLINPVVVASEGEILKEESCLSVPGRKGKVKRAAKITIENSRLTGESYSFTAEGMLARAILHEIDHLKGKLFIDYLGGSNV
jgi:peptide deformylase